MTIIAMLRLVSVPSALVEEIHAHSPSCPVCRRTREQFGGRETRRCDVAEALVERCVNYQMAKAHPEGSR